MSNYIGVVRIFHDISRGEKHIYLQREDRTWTERVLITQEQIVDYLHEMLPLQKTTTFNVETIPKPIPEHKLKGLQDALDFSI